MIKKTIRYVDFNGVERTEDFYFNLSKAEIIEMNLNTDGGLKELIDRIMNAKDQLEIVKLFKLLIEKSYGAKSPDGRKFMKSPEILADFEATQAYSDLYSELTTNPEKAAEFFNGMMPAEFQDAAAEANAPLLMPAT